MLLKVIYMFEEILLLALKIHGCVNVCPPDIFLKFAHIFFSFTRPETKDQNRAELPFKDFRQS